MLQPTESKTKQRSISFQHFMFTWFQDYKRR